jgi:hypothetical protein
MLANLFPTDDSHSESYELLTICKENSLCSICLENINCNSKILICNHVYHEICINSWFENNTTCPNCRINIPGDNIGKQDIGESPIENALVSDYSLYYILSIVCLFIGVPLFLFIFFIIRTYLF